jgi:hypothetical protein
MFVEFSTVQVQKDFQEFTNGSELDQIQWYVQPLLNTISVYSNYEA